MTLPRRTLLRMAALSAAVPSLGFEGGPRPAKRGMIVRSARPEDLEMPPDGFLDYITPIERFYVRSHHYEPRVDIASWRLKVDGEVGTPLTLTMEDLKKLPRAEVVAVGECAGNGRSFYRPTMPGLQWAHGSVGNGRWTGVRLADVLRKAGLKSSATEILFDGADVPVGTMPDFQRTIPVKKALDPNTVLAYEMNGQTLPNQHGFPLRVVTPGWASDSWVKWITGIRVLDKEFDGFFMKTAYRHPGKPVRPGEAVDPVLMHPVTSLRVKSVIATPLDGAQLPIAPIAIHGAAWAGDAGAVSAVDVSTDGGRTWLPAKLGADRSQFGWRLFSHSFTPAKAQFYTIMARARTASGDSQPFAQEWNPSGYGWNVVHSVGVNVSDKPAQQAAPSPAAKRDHPAGYRAACLACHGEDVIEQQKLTEVQWQREIDKMVRWGAEVKEPDRAGILRYLASHFGAK